jgi:hypothetical protein
VLVSGDVSVRLTARAAPLRVGDVLHLRAEINTAAGTVTLRGSGIVITAPLPPDFPPDSRLSARVVALKPAVRLEILPAESARFTGQPPSIPVPRSPPPRDLLIETLLRALVSARPAAQPALINHAAGLYRRYYGEPRQDERRRVLLRRARGMLELADRDLEPTRTDDASREDHGPGRSRQLEHLLYWFAGSTGFDRPEKREDGGRSAGTYERAENTGITSLADYLCRAVEIPHHLLQLYNSLAPNGEIHWVVVPIRGWREPDPQATGGDACDLPVDAVLKIGWHRGKGVPVEAILSVERKPDDCWWFRWRIERTSKTTTLSLVESGGERSSVDRELLARLGYTGHTERDVTRVAGDGFALQPVDPAPPGGVDTYG